jgi:hypothetical protein
LKIDLTLDLSALQTHQHAALSALLNSFAEPLVIPTSDETHPAPAKRTRRPKLPAVTEAASPAPAASVTDLQQAYCDLVSDITSAITAGELSNVSLNGALRHYRIDSVPALSNRLDLVPELRKTLFG